MSEFTWIHKDAVCKRCVSPGLVVYDMWRGKDGRLAQVVEIAPGAVYPGEELHEPGPEECYVVSGVFNDGLRSYPAGTFIHNPAGSRHTPQSNEGCVLFLFYPDG
ncbi:MAG: cupin domain-containing protein [Gammaproteobacteria bacterium]|nr:cupin domain-containing protein [Gammaproteobacteria bacterium]